MLAFPTLYKENCAACHGENGKNGVVIPLANPVYLDVAGEDRLRQIIANGVPGKLMPPFAKSAGGMLTDQQVASLAQGIVQHVGQPRYSSRTKPSTLSRHSTRRSDPRPASLHYFLRPLPRRRRGRLP